MQMTQGVERAVGPLLGRGGGSYRVWCRVPSGTVTVCRGCGHDRHAERCGPDWYGGRLHLVRLSWSRWPDQ